VKEDLKMSLFRTKNNILVWEINGTKIKVIYKTDNYDKAIEFVNSLSQEQKTGKMYKIEREG
jgi:pterin-4a-carbinolamine dehydratase